MACGVDLSLSLSLSPTPIAAAIAVSDGPALDLRLDFPSSFLILSSSFLAFFSSS